MKYITCFFFVFTTVSLKGYQLKDEDLKCRYRVHLPTASWHTAHAVCRNSAQELVRIGSIADRDFIHDVLGAADQMMAAGPIKNNYSDVWIGAIMRSSSNESLHLNCKPFKLDVKKTDPRPIDEIVCIYYNFTDGKFYPDSCTKNKTFVCENKSKVRFQCRHPFQFRRRPFKFAKLIYSANILVFTAIKHPG
ncbi:uncharacterized protein LOC134243264, partial [Saccostrea cucullata]|uniref:uncharacterized protein LOC134243264 n=1 Tax=Saccostrea cuccullata TaxID=36930 RepID=UPI002ECFF17E